MPITQASTTTFSDHRIFGFDQYGQIRANLHNSPASHAPGAMYSWLTCATVDQLANRLAALWEQPLSQDEFEVLEQLEASNDEPRCSLCNSANVSIESYDFAVDRETGYSDSGEVIHCLDCGARERYEPETAILPRKPATAAQPTITPGVAA